MNKTVVVYKSKTGFAKKYAEWIAEDLKCDIKENNKLTLSDISSYETIIFGGGLYAVGINGIKLLKDNYENIKDKNIIVYATGATPPREEDLKKVWESNLTEEQNKNVAKYYFRGGFDYSKLSMGNKVLMSMLKTKLQKEKNPSEDAAGMLTAYDKPVDFTDRVNIKELVEYVSKL